MSGQQAVTNTTLETSTHVMRWMVGVHQALQQRVGYVGAPVIA